MRLRWQRARRAEDSRQEVGVAGARGKRLKPSVPPFLVLAPRRAPTLDLRDWRMRSAGRARKVQATARTADCKRRESASFLWLLAPHRGGILHTPYAAQRCTSPAW